MILTTEFSANRVGHAVANAGPAVAPDTKPTKMHHLCKSVHRLLAIISISGPSLSSINPVPEGISRVQTAHHSYPCNRSRFRDQSGGLHESGLVVSLSGYVLIFSSDMIRSQHSLIFVFHHIHVVLIDKILMIYKCCMLQGKDMSEVLAVRDDELGRGRRRGRVVGNCRGMNNTQTGSGSCRARIISFVISILRPYPSSMH